MGNIKTQKASINNSQHRQWWRLDGICSIQFEMWCAFSAQHSLKIGSKFICRILITLIPYGEISQCRQLRHNCGQSEKFMKTYCVHSPLCTHILPKLRQSNKYLDCRDFKCLLEITSTRGRYFNLYLWCIYVSYFLIRYIYTWEMRVFSHSLLKWTEPYVVNVVQQLRLFWF